MKNAIEHFLSGRDYKEISLYGFIYMFFAVISVAALTDTLTHNYADASIEAAAVVCNGALLYYLRRTGDIRRTSLIVVWLSALAVFAIVLVNDFRHASFIFLFFAPFSFYLVLDRQRLLLHAAAYYVMMLVLLFYGFLYSSNRELFDDTMARTALLSAILFVIAIGIFIYYAIQYSFDRLETSNREKELLLREVHHRVKNNLNMISSILGLQHTGNDRALRELVTRNRERIQAIATVHEMLYRHDTLDRIDCREYIERLTQEMLRGCDRCDIAVRLDVETILLPLEEMIHFGLMIQEMFVNSLKHALAKGGTITIRLLRHGTKILFEYFDSGGGCDLSRLKKARTLGYDLIRFSVKKLHGTLDIRNRPGLCYRMEFAYA